ncbi:MAG: hypothetical protein AAF639_01445 [Chloroflexota bacterium]
MSAFFKRRSLFRPSPFQMTLSYLMLGIWAFIVLFPLYWLVVTSFKLPLDVNSGPVYMPFVDFQPSNHAWTYIFVDVWNDTVRPYINTLIIGLVSSAIALLLGTAAAYALVRFEYRPKLDVIGIFILCMLLTIAAIIHGVPWYLAVVAALVLFLIMA